MYKRLKVLTTTAVFTSTITSILPITGVSAIEGSALIGEQSKVTKFTGKLYTENSTDGAFKGASPNEIGPSNCHINVQGDVLTFYGYYAPAYKDFILYEDNTPKTKTYSFTLNELQMDWHTVIGGGFIFNSQVVDDKLSGYVVLWTQNQGIVMHLQDVPLATLHAPGDIRNLGTTIHVFEKTSTFHDLKLVTTKDELRMNDNGVTRVFKLPKVYGSGFGPIAAYSSHSCSSLSIFKFGDLGIQKMEDISSGASNMYDIQKTKKAIDIALSGIAFGPDTNESNVQSIVDTCLPSNGTITAVIDNFNNDGNKVLFDVVIYDELNETTYIYNYVVNIEGGEKIDDSVVIDLLRSELDNYISDENTKGTDIIDYLKDKVPSNVLVTYEGFSNKVEDGDNFYTVKDTILVYIDGQCYELPYTFTYQSVEQAKEEIEKVLRSYKATNRSTKESIMEYIADNAIISSNIEYGFDENVDDNFFIKKATGRYNGSLSGFISISNTNNGDMDIATFNKVIEISQSNQTVDKVKPLVKEVLEKFTPSNKTTEKDIIDYIYNSGVITDDTIELKFGRGEDAFKKVEATDLDEGSITGGLQIIQNQGEFSETAVVPIDKSIAKLSQTLEDVGFIISDLLDSFVPTNDTTEEDVINYIKDSGRITNPKVKFKYYEEDGFTKEKATWREEGYISGTIIAYKKADKDNVTSPDEDDYINNEGSDENKPEGGDASNPSDNDGSIDEEKPDDSDSSSGELELPDNQTTGPGVSVKPDKDPYDGYDTIKVDATRTIKKLKQQGSDVVSIFDELLAGLKATNKTTEESVLEYIKDSGLIEDSNINYRFNEERPFKKVLATEAISGYISGLVDFYEGDVYIGSLDIRKPIKKLESTQKVQSLEEVADAIAKVLNKYRPTNYTTEKDILDYIGKSGVVTNPNINVAFDKENPFTIVKATRDNPGRITGVIEASNGETSIRIPCEKHIEQLRSGSSNKGGGGSVNEIASDRGNSILVGMAVDRTGTSSMGNFSDLKVTQSKADVVNNEFIKGVCTGSLPIWNTAGVITPEIFNWEGVTPEGVKDSGNLVAVKDKDGKDLGLIISKETPFEKATKVKTKPIKQAQPGDVFNVYSWDYTIGKCHKIAENVLVDSEGCVEFETTAKQDYIVTKEPIDNDLVASKWVKWDTAEGIKWLYFDELTDERLTGWYAARPGDWERFGQDCAGTWFHLDEQTGIMDKGWLEDNGKWYYLEDGDDSQNGGFGGAVTGWLSYNSDWYYLDEDNCAMVTGWRKVGNDWYYFNQDGSMAYDTTIDGYQLDSNGKWV